MSAGLRRYIIVRALLTIPMLLILVSIVFLVLRVVPGDPALTIMHDGASKEQLAASDRGCGQSSDRLIAGQNCKAILHVRG